MKLPDDKYKRCGIRIILHKKSEKFSIGKVVRQGDIISPKLFAACLEEIFSKIDWDNVG